MSNIEDNPQRDSRSDARKAEPTITPGLEEVASSHASISEARMQHARNILKTEGFSAEQIDAIEARFPGTELRVYRPALAEPVSDVAQAMIELTESTNVPVVSKVGSVLLIAELKNTAQSAVDRYTAEETAQAKYAESHFKELPDFLKTWVNGCGDRNYGRVLDIQIAADAKLVADELKTPEAIQTWADLPSKEQCNRVPGLSSGHSGASFAQVVGLAIGYLEEAGA
jgi:hypothetical protein